ncbi:RICIN domain-containing protein [Streptomyces sp. NPDC001811]
MERDNAGELEDVQDVAHFMTLLRQLKARSGLSYRRLEERAAAVGDVLPRSSLCTMLSRDRPPGPDLLAAFVRACGDGERVALWCAARDRVVRPSAPAEEASWLSAEAPAVPSGAVDDAARPPVDRGTREDGGSGDVAPPGPGTGPRRPRLGRHRRALTVVAAALLTIALGVVVAFRQDQAPWRQLRAGGPPSGVPAGGRPTPPGGWVTIRIAEDPELCLTDGRVRDWRYTPLVAVQRPCAEAAPQSTLLEPAGEGRYHIVWYHPDYGRGCLKALTDGDGAGLLEPMDVCSDGSLFTIEPSGELRRGRFVLRVEGSGCVGIAGSSSAHGAEAVMQRCEGKGRQLFLIRRAG